VSDNVSYQLRSGKEVNDTSPLEILAVCPIHGYAIHSDGSFTTSPRK